ncbi:MAG: glucose 1-dehydrogenase [Smithellaceae bacterium]|jgi:NAD(P)-dependent dehydrogenase (short-subunit alcohol dehydrogenase family)|nr:glucose 1-dehydrogenase [Smithellaceae bacterium]
MLKEFSLEDKVTLITGAGRGIGRAIASTFAEAGADIAAASRTTKELAETTEEVMKQGRKCVTMPTDINNPEHLRRLVDATLAAYGKIDILVNNAGLGSMKMTIPIPGVEKMRIAKSIPDLNEPLTDEEWNRLWGTNVKGGYDLIRLVVPGMIQNKKGKIINIVSTAAVKYTALQGVYPATKAAVVALSKSLANELARFNINVNCIGPGGVITAMLEKIHSNEEMSQGYLRSVPLRRFGEPREVGLLALYLASEASDYMTGQTLYLDGGYTIS